MSRTIKSVLLGLLLCAGFISCEKEYSVENGVDGPVSSGTAIYTFDGAPNACNSPVVNGTYKQGSPLGASNTVVLSVNVATAGTYTVATSIVNGVSFTATSSFSATGAQIIQLTGKGTPTAAGTFSYTPGNGCAFSITFSGSGGTSSGTAVYTCTSITANGTYTQNTTLGSSNTLVLQVNVTTAGTYTIDTGLSDNFSFSGSGTLATGAQTITLVGSGTPNTGGTVTIKFSTGCSVDIMVADAGGGTGGSGDFLKATIGGTAYTFNNDLSGQITNVTTGPSELDIDGTLNSTAMDEFSIGFFNITGLLNVATYKNLSATNTNKFADVNYTDAAGNVYVPILTNANAFSVVITTLTATGATGTFSGTLTITNSSGGFGTATKSVTNGSFSVTF